MYKMLCKLLEFVFLEYLDDFIVVLENILV